MWRKGEEDRTGGKERKRERLGPKDSTSEFSVILTLTRIMLHYMYILTTILQICKHTHTHTVQTGTWKPKHMVGMALSTAVQEDGLSNKHRLIST